MKKIVCVFLAAASLTFLSSGCSDLKSKFVRKSEKEPGLRTYIPVQEYDIRPSMDLYTKRYIFWKNWHREFMDLIRDPRMSNQKKITVALEQEISNLYDMRRMLVDARGDELQGYIDKVQKIENDLKTQTLTMGNRVRIQRTMDLLGKGIQGRFSYRKVTGEIRDEFRKD
jgi:hypothetical protein